MRSTPRRFRPLVLLSALAVMGLGCGTQTVAAPRTFTGSADEVRTARVGHLGKILVDGQGFTLYVLAADDGSGHSTCFDVCADEWPPMTLQAGDAAPIAGPGINPSLLHLTSRPDGTEQVTYNGWPLYRWPDDSEPGMATGENVDDESGYWYVLNASGNVVR